MGPDKLILALKSMLVDTVSDNDTIFIVTHIDPDFDAIGSVLALADSINAMFGKKVYIIIDDDYSTIKSGIKCIINEVKDKVSIIASKQLPDLLTDKSLLIVTDANAENRVSVKDNLDQFNDILIIDHHSRNERTIKSGKKYINSYMSSACEIVSRLLYSLGYMIPPVYATYLYAGIMLDTNNFKNSMNSETSIIKSKLVENGANLVQVDNLFKGDPYHNKIISELIKKGRIIEILNTKIALASDSKNEPIAYFPEDLAMVANGLLTDKVEISVALGYISDDIIAISARSKGNINAASIMNGFGGGGGQKWAAATRINSSVLGNVNLNNGTAKQQILEEIETSLIGFMVSGGYFFQQIDDNSEKNKKEYKKVRITRNSKEFAS